MLGSPRAPQAQRIELVACLVDPECGVPAERPIVGRELSPGDITGLAVVLQAPVIVQIALLSTLETRICTIIQTRVEAAEVNPYFLFPDVQIGLVHSGDCVVFTIIF